MNITTLKTQPVATGLPAPAPSAAQAPAAPAESFTSSPKDDWAAFKPSQALQDWAAKAEVKTIPQMFEQALAKDPNARFLGHKTAEGKFEFISYAEANKQRKQLAGGLVELGIQPGERVATYAENSPEWVVGDLGIISAGAVHAPLYRDSKADAISFNLKNCKAKVCIVDSDERLAELLKCEKDLPDLKTIVVMHPTELKSTKNVITWDQLLAPGDKNAAEVAKRESELKATDVASMVFTSGTTGTPKGVLHTHGSLLSSVEGALRVVVNNPAAQMKDVHLNGDVELAVLPLGHIFERIVAYTLTAGGAALAYTDGHKNFLSDLTQVKPTVMASIPQLYDKMVDGAAKKAHDTSKPLVHKVWGPLGGAAAGGVVGGLLAGISPIGAAIGAAIGAGAGLWASKKTTGQAFDWAVNTSEKYYQQESKGKVELGTRLQHAVAEKLVYSKTKKGLQDALGPNTRILISGGAPLSDRTSAFFWDNGLQLSNGYGSSEAGVTNVSPIKGQRLGTVGPIVSNVKMEITPDKDFEGAGEIRFQGPNLMLGYLNDPKKTEEAIDKDGFFHTGDVGKTDAAGHVMITDRLKNFIALATGKKVAPKPLETTLKTNPYIAQAIVVGEGRPYIGALIVPNYEKLGEWAKANGHGGDTREALASIPAVKEFFQGITKELTKNNDDHEQVRKVAIVPRDLTEDELAKGEPKRAQVIKTFGDLVDSIYKK
ncbi:MAG: AMP-binding protein [Vulcanimicrobiota bacterium]